MRLAQDKMTAFLFDIDNTLTPPRQKIDASFLMFFLGWMKDKNVYLVTGSNEKKIKEQLPTSLLGRCAGIFSNMGNKFTIDNKIIYENLWKPNLKLLKYLSEQRNNSSYPNKKAVWWESRIGMMNYTIAGRFSSNHERSVYEEWDIENLERQRIASEIEEKFPDLEAKLGGQISIDIQPKGNNKSLASKWIRKNKTKDMVFFGDKCFEGGNDYDVKVDVLENGGTVFEVGEYRNTLSILENADL